MNATIIHKLENARIRPTPMRMLVLEQLVLQSGSMNLNDLEELLYPSDRITIYRTLQTFVRKGLVHVLETADKGFFYALCSEGCTAEAHKDGHPHFYCESCQKFSCAKDFDIQIALKPQAEAYQIHQTDILIKGLCPGCRKG